MSEKPPSPKELMSAATLIVVSLAGAWMFLIANPSSPSQTGNILSRFIYASVYSLVPTSEFAVYLELGLAALSAFTIAKVDLRAALLTIFTGYVGINFVVAWYSAPV